MTKEGQHRTHRTAHNANNNGEEDAHSIYLFKERTKNCSDYDDNECLGWDEKGTWHIIFFSDGLRQKKGSPFFLP